MIIYLHRKCNSESLGNVGSAKSLFYCVRKSSANEATTIITQLAEVWGECYISNFIHMYFQKVEVAFDISSAQVKHNKN